MTTKAVQEFNFRGSMVRVVMVQDDPWWVAKDVCSVLGIGNSRDIITALDVDEKGVEIIDTPGGPQRMGVVNEPGLYSLILRSRKPEAKAFKRWVTHEVLPALRQRGVYTTLPFDVDEIKSVKDLIKLVQVSRNQINRHMMELLVAETARRCGVNLLEATERVQVDQDIDDGSTFCEAFYNLPAPMVKNVSEFLDSLYPERPVEIKATELYHNLTQWRIEHSKAFIGKATFERTLKALGMNSKRSGRYRYWTLN